MLTRKDTDMLDGDGDYQKENRQSEASVDHRKGPSLEHVTTTYGTEALDIPGMTSRTGGICKSMFKHGLISLR